MGKSTQLFLWPCSIAMLNYQRVCVGLQTLPIVNISMFNPCWPSYQLAEFIGPCSGGNWTNMDKSAGRPACLIGRCCSFSVLGLYLFLPSPTILLLLLHLLLLLIVPLTFYSTTVVYRCSFGMLSIGCSSTRLLLKLLLTYGSVFFSSSSSSSSYSSFRLLLLLFFLLLLPLLLLSSASLSGFHLACTSTSLGATSLRSHPVPFHAAVCCQAREYLALLC